MPMRQLKNSNVLWIGNIPTEWNVCKIKYCLDRNDGGVWGMDPTDSEKDKIVLRSTEQTIDGHWDISNPATRNIGINCQQYKINKGDLLITKSSGSSLHIGKTTLADDYFNENECYYSNFLQRLRVDKTIVPKFLWYLMNNPTVREQFVFMQNSTIGIGNINADNINAVIVPIPPIKEQENIISYLDEQCSEIESLSADIQSQIDVLEEYKKSVITESVTKGLNPDVKMKESGIEWIGMIPAHWDVHPVYHYFGERKVKNSALREQNLLSLSYGKIVRKDIESLGGLLPASFNTYNIVEAGDIIIRPTDLQNDKRSLRTGLVTEHGIITSAYIDLMPKAYINSKYFHYLLHSYDVMKVFYNMGNGVRQGLNYSEFAKLMIFAPSTQEQKEIANHLDAKCAEIDATIADKKAQLETLAEYKKSLIYEYVTGKKEVPIKENEIDLNAILLGAIVNKLGEYQTGRIQLQKILYLTNMYLGINSRVQYYRYGHGPYDINLNRCIDTLTENKWFEEKTEKSSLLVKGAKVDEFLNKYKEQIDSSNGKIVDLLNLLYRMNSLKRSKLERITTLYATWNDFLLDGVNPTDDQIIQEVMTNWTDNKSNTQYATWQDSLDKMKKNGLVPKGTGLHTISRS